MRIQVHTTTSPVNSFHQVLVSAGEENGAAPARLQEGGDVRYTHTHTHTQTSFSNHVLLYTFQLS